MPSTWPEGNDSVTAPKKLKCQHDSAGRLTTSNSKKHGGTSWAVLQKKEIATVASWRASRTLAPRPGTKWRYSSFEAAADASFNRCQLNLRYEWSNIKRFILPICSHSHHWGHRVFTGCYHPSLHWKHGMMDNCIPSSVSFCSPARHHEHVIRTTRSYIHVCGHEHD